MKQLSLFPEVIITRDQLCMELDDLFERTLARTPAHHKPFHEVTIALIRQYLLDSFDEKGRVYFCGKDSQGPWRYRCSGSLAAYCPAAAPRSGKIGLRPPFEWR